MNILVTGAHGQVGTEVVQSGITAGHDIIALSSSALDISNAEAVPAAIAHYKPQVVINAAAYTAVDLAEQERPRAYQVNRDGPRHLALACAGEGIPLIHISTDYVFDGIKHKPYREDDIAAPTGVYGDSKWQGEQAVRDILDQHIILRVSWVFGSHGNNFVKTIIRLARERRSLTIVSDQHGGPTYAGDIASALLQLAEQVTLSRHAAWGTYHYCGLPPVSWYVFAQSIVDLAGRYESLAVDEVVPITTAEYPTIAKRPANSILDCRKLQEVFGIVPGNWRDGLAKTIKLLATQKALIEAQ